MPKAVLQMASTGSVSTVLVGIGGGETWWSISSGAISPEMPDSVMALRPSAPPTQNFCFWGAKMLTRALVQDWASRQLELMGLDSWMRSGKMSHTENCPEEKKMEKALSWDPTGVTSEMRSSKDSLEISDGGDTSARRAARRRSEALGGMTAWKEAGTTARLPSSAVCWLSCCWKSGSDAEALARSGSLGRSGRVSEKLRRTRWPSIWGTRARSGWWKEGSPVAGGVARSSAKKVASMSSLAETKVLMNCRAGSETPLEDLLASDCRVLVSASRM